MQPGLQTPAFPWSVGTPLDFLPPGSRGLVLGDQISRPVVTPQGASEQARYKGPGDSAQPKAREPGQGHSPRQPAVWRSLGSCRSREEAVALAQAPPLLAPRPPVGPDLAG